MNIKTPIVISMAAMLTLTACDPGPAPANGQTRMANGAVLGGLAGAFFGATREGDNKLKNAALGAAFGAAYVMAGKLHPRLGSLRPSRGGD